MKTQYILFLIINNIKKFKDVKKKLIELDYKRFTVIDTYGSTDLSTKMEYSKLLADTMGERDDKKYNKTVFLILDSEEEVIKVMDELEETININTKKPGKGIMFTVPIIMSHGVRF